jgi:hypothetical protein
LWIHVVKDLYEELVDAGRVDGEEDVGRQGYVGEVQETGEWTFVEELFSRSRFDHVDDQVRHVVGAGSSSHHRAPLEFLDLEDLPECSVVEFVESHENLEEIDLTVGPTL